MPRRPVHDGPIRAALAVLLLLWAPMALGQARLVPADPQPDAAALRPGLGVEYVYPADVKRLSDANGWNEHYRKPGPALVGFDYPDTSPGERTLTSDVAERVIAFIDGYIRFDRPGVWRLEFWSNDGLQVRIGGVEVYKHDLRHPCETLGWQEFTVPEAGWYEVEAVYFQRLNTACMMMKWQAPGEGGLSWTPQDVYAHRPR